MNTAIPVTSGIKSWVMDTLGDRQGNTGFIHKYSSTIAAISLLTPIVVTGVSFALNHGHEVPAKLREARHWVSSQMFPPDDLDQRGIAGWYAKKTIKVLLTAALVTAVIVSIYVITKLEVSYTFAQGVWQLLNKLPVIREILYAVGKPNPSIVYPGYICIALAHLYRAKKALDKGEKIAMLQNIFAAAISLLTIEMMVTNVYAARWHHMSYGLLCMLPSNFALNFFGGLMTADSMLYWIRPLKDDYDFSNIFVKHVSLFVIQLICITILELLDKKIQKNTRL